MKVAIIGGTGEGGAPLTTGTVGQTPDHQPNIVVKVVQPIIAILVRFGHTFLLTFSGSIGLSLTPVGGQLMPASDLEQRLTHAALIGLSAAAAGLLKDLITIFGRLENKYPIWTGNV
jgi:hypothetical protein